MRDGRAEQPERAHLAQDFAVEMLVEIGLGDARLELGLGIALGGIADHPLLVAELVVEAERIFPIERQNPWLAHVVTPLFAERVGRPFNEEGRARLP